MKDPYSFFTAFLVSSITILWYEILMPEGGRCFLQAVLIIKFLCCFMVAGPFSPRQAMAGFLLSDIFLAVLLFGNSPVLAFSAEMLAAQAALFIAYEWQTRFEHLMEEGW